MRFTRLLLATGLAFALGAGATAMAAKESHHDTAKGAAAGAVAGHEMGHGHAMAGAATGAAIGHHEQAKADRRNK